MELPKNLMFDKDQKWEIAHFDEITNFLWANKKKILDMPSGFNYPNYGGLPKRLGSKISSDFADGIQGAFYDLDYHDKFYVDKTTKKEFCKMCGRYLFAR